MLEPLSWQRGLAHLGNWKKLGLVGDSPAGTKDESGAMGPWGQSPRPSMGAE